MHHDNAPRDGLVVAIVDELVTIISLANETSGCRAFGKDFQCPHRRDFMLRSSLPPPQGYKFHAPMLH